MKWFKFFFLLLLLLAAYLTLWPTNVDPVGWTPDPIPELEGDLAPNEALSKVTYLFRGLCIGCEDVAISADGAFFGGSEDGNIYAFRSLSAKKGDLFAHTGGRPLGMHFDAQENLWVCDATKGLLKVSPEGGVMTMATEHQGKRFKFTNDLDIGRDGKVYFTDTSDKYSSHNYKFDILEHRPRGRFMVYDPKGQQLELLADDLYFANGVALAPDESFALVCETTHYRVRKIWLSGPKKGQSEFILENLPGYPDGISQGGNNVFWLTLISPRKGYLEQLLPKPFLTKMISRLPNFLQPAPTRYGMVLGIDQNGKIIHNLQSSKPNFAQISSVQETYGQLFFGSLGETGIGRIPVPQK